MSKADTNQASELFELCKKVYERTEWQGDFLSNWGWVQAHGEYEVDNGCTDGLPPLYTSDYLLERLPKGVSVMKEQLTNNYNAGLPRVHRSVSDTPLKALLKLTIALSEAGELK